MRFEDGADSSPGSFAFELRYVLEKNGVGHSTHSALPVLSKAFEMHDIAG